MNAVAQLMSFYPRIFFACHTRHVRDLKSGSVISAHQASILDHLDEIEPTGLNDLAGHMGVTASTMCITVDRLVRGGYVKRGPDPRDGRRVALRITRSGARLRDKKTVLDRDLVRGLLLKLTGAERREALRGLELLAGAADELVRHRSKKTVRLEGAAL
jgi:MarR family transcriptional regulator, organic hydroperoxide resistance regulator